MTGWFAPVICKRGKFTPARPSFLRSGDIGGDETDNVADLKLNFFPYRRDLSAGRILK